MDAIRRGAAALFQTLQLRDYVRVDGWYLPAASLSAQAAQKRFMAGAGRGNELVLEDGSVVVYSDINLASGMEQTSFLFQQAAMVRALIEAAMVRALIEAAMVRTLWPEGSNAGLRKQEMAIVLYGKGREVQGVQWPASTLRFCVACLGP